MAGQLEYSATPSSNTTVNGIGIQGSSTIKNGDDALRQLMADAAASITRHVTKTVGSYTALKADFKQLWRATGAVTVNLTAAATLTDGWCLFVKADGGAITIDPAGAETINGAATLAIGDGSSAFIVCTGAAFFAIVFGDVTMNGTQTLTNKTLTSPTITTPTLTLKQSAAPVPTAEGVVEWDTDDNVLAIGDGAATKVFLPIPASTAAGDTEYFTAAKVKARLPKGAAGQRYQMNAGATAPEWADGVAGGTNIATTSGTAIDVTSIPAYAKEITINFSGVSTNGTSLVIVQLGDSGGIETSGYNGCTSGITNAVITNAHSSGFIVHTNNSANATIHGSIELTREDSATNTWAASITTGLSDSAYVSVGGGSKALSATLDRVRITTVAGTNTFDAGSLNVTYEA